MSEFTLALMVLGGLTIAGVLAHGAWISRRNQIRQPDPLTPQDAAFAASRLPSRFSELGDGRPEPVWTTDELSLDGQDSVLGADSRPAWVPPQEKRAGPDGLIDSVAIITLEQEVSGDAVLAHLPTVRRVGTKPLSIDAQTSADTPWEYPQPGKRYHRLQMGVQLANRTGPLTDIEFSEFLVLVHHVADALGGTAETAEMRSEIMKARELDHFASQHDAQFSLYLFSKKVAWSTGFVQQCAMRLGFVAGILPGRFVLPGHHEGAAPLLALNFDSQAALSNTVDGPGIRQLSLTLDLPQVARTDQPFALMRQIAERLAVAMDAGVGDENGTPVTPEILDQIEGDLQTLYERLQERELDAGSALARRLFS